MEQQLQAQVQTQQLAAAMGLQQANSIQGIAVVGAAVGVHSPFGVGAGGIGGGGSTSVSTSGAMQAAILMGQEPSSSLAALPEDANSAAAAPLTDSEGGAP